MAKKQPLARLARGGSAGTKEDRQSGTARLLSPPKQVQDKMLQTSRQSSDSDEEPDLERAYFVLALIDSPCEQVKAESRTDYVTRTSIAKAIERAAK